MKVSDISISSFSANDFKELKNIHGTALQAAVEHVKRQARDSHPEGEFDGGGRFFIKEGCSCCSDIRSPSRSHPYSYMVHGRTLAHCAVLFEVDLDAAKDALRGVKRIAKKYDLEKASA